MTLKELIIKAAHLAKDLPTDTALTGEGADVYNDFKGDFDAESPRYSCDIYRDWVNEANTELLHLLPANQIRAVFIDTEDTAGGRIDMPDDMLYPTRVTIAYTPDVPIGARHRTQAYMLATEQNTWLKGTATQPIYTYENRIDEATYNSIRFMPIPTEAQEAVGVTCSIQYIRSRILTLIADTPDIQVQHHHLIAEMAALKKMVADNDAAGPGLNKKIQERIETLIKADKETGVK